VLDPDSVADDVEFPEWGDFKRLLLAIEIISPSSVRIDRIIKRDFHLDAGVPEYWIVDLDARIIERWTQGRESPEVCGNRSSGFPKTSGSL
jgi:Uma2 family endonuclease